MKNIYALFIALIFTTTAVNASCVWGAKDKTKFTRLDNHRIILTGGYGSDILIKTFCFIYSSSEVQVLKDSFCSYESSALYIDGEVCDVNQVDKL